jgi:hypothetical protein
LEVSIGKGPDHLQAMIKRFFKEKRAEPRSIVDRYYCVEFSTADTEFVYQFKIWNLSPKGICVVIREDSALVRHLKVGDILEMKYYTIDSPAVTDYLRTEIQHITKDEGRFKGHYLVGLSVFEK